MNALGYLTIGLSAVWLASEVIISKRRSSSSPESRSYDKLSFFVMWVGILVSIAVAVTLMFILRSTGRIDFLSPIFGYVGCLIIVAGLFIRWGAIRTLGKHFTAQVSIVDDHKIVDTGIYGIVRHPSYLGSLICLIGLGLALENWISLLILFFLPVAATLYRIAVEEKVLLRHFGKDYEEYSRRTKRLIPGIY